MLEGGALDPKQIHRAYGVSPSLVRKYMDSGDLGYVRWGRKRLVPKKILLEFLEAHFVPGRA